MYMGKHLPYILVGAGIQKIHVDVDMITKQLIQEVAQMTEHKRLTTKEKYPHGAEGVSKDKLTGKYCRGVFEATACVEKLAEYENAEEEGRLVVLPSNQVYAARKDFKLVYKRRTRVFKEGKKSKKCCRTYHRKQRRYDADGREDER